MNTLVDLLRDASVKYGPSTALTIALGVRQRPWSYSRLWDLSGRVSTVLAEHGLSKGDRAIIWAPNSPEWVAAFFGCLRAGVVVVPLDVRSAPDFVARVMAGTEPKLAFLSRQTLLAMPESSIATLFFEDLEEILEKATPGESEPSLEPDDIAELMYTSGTTGEPKGVILTHRNLVSNATASRSVIPVNSSNKLLSLMPLSHMLEQTGGLLTPPGRWGLHRLLGQPPTAHHLQNHARQPGNQPGVGAPGAPTVHERH
jgi:long-chain acyl-CoA synthetase